MFGFKTINDELMEALKIRDISLVKMDDRITDDEGALFGFPQPCYTPWGEDEKVFHGLSLL